MRFGLSPHQWKSTICTLTILCFVIGYGVRGQRHGQRLCPRGCFCRISPDRRILYSVRCMNLGFASIPHFSPGTRSLDLRFNSIRRISRESFRGLTNLNTLLLTNNNIEVITTDAFVDLKSLKHLYIQKNAISKIEANGFRGLNSLEQLYMYDNKITTLEPSTFSSLEKLERLFLYSNKLATLPPNIFSDLVSLKRLRLDNNNLECNCDLLWFRQWLSSVSRNVQITAICHSPRKLSGRAVRTVPEEEFKCSEPIISVEPADTQVEQGGTIYLACITSGSPRPSIIWFHNGAIVQENARTRKNHDGGLMIMNARESDAGMYKCKATNNIGTVESKEARVFHRGLNGPPFFMTLPHSRQVMTGEPATLDCRAAGNPDPIVTWEKDGNSLPERAIVMPSGALHISTAHMYHNGSYTCVATNSEGTVNTTADILVQSVPVFTERPEDIQVLQGQSATLDCHTYGIPRPTITWLKDGDPLARDQRYLVMSSGSLLIRVTNPDDSGSYTCRAHSTAGTSEASATLTVQIPPHFIVRPQNQRVRQGRTVDFQCQASGRPPPHIVWTKNGRAIPDDTRYNILASGTLRILRADTTDAGNYRCEIANSFGARDVLVTLEIIPLLPLAFTRTSSDQEVASGSQVHLTCHVSGESEDAPVVISWSKDGVGIVPSERFQIAPAPTSSLTISSVARDDAGRYECTARNEGSVIMSSMSLTVNIGNTVEEIVSELMDLLPDGCLQQGCTAALDVDDLSDEDIDYLVDFNREFVSSEPRSSSRRSKRQSGPIQSNLVTLSNSVFAVQRDVDIAINSTIQQLNSRDHSQNPHNLFSLMRFPSSRRSINLIKAAEVFEVSLKVIECCIRQGARIRHFALRHSQHIGRKKSARDEQQLFDISPTDISEQGDDPKAFVSPVIGTEVVALVANLSGCSAHQKPPDCSENICFHRKFRSADGTCNNLQHPMWGASLTPFHRILQPIYENGFNSPVGWNPEKKYHNETLPSPRKVSVEVLMSRNPRPATDADFTHMTMQWGQFVDHDLDFTTMAPSIQRFSDGTACKDTCDHEAPCFPIEVETNDPRHGRFNHHSQGSNSGSRRRPQHHHGSGSCMEFTRSSAVCGSGITSVFFSALSRREQINQITSYQDGSSIYGSTEEEMRNLRDLSNDLGLLKEGQPLEPGQKPLLPYNVYTDLGSGTVEIRPVAPIECRRGNSESPLERSVPCFLAGDLRANEQVSLTAMHTLFMREHNRIARQLKEMNSHWKGDTIFHEARKIVGAQMQHITYSHWLPKLLGPYMNVVGDYRMYDPNQPASIVNVFATAAYRFGHTMINPIMYSDVHQGSSVLKLTFKERDTLHSGLQSTANSLSDIITSCIRLNETWKEIPQGNLMLHQAFFAPYRIVHEGGIDPLIRGLIAKPMKARDADSNMNSELIERLFELAEEVALDLGALNVQRGRDHALPFYNEWREYCNLTKVSNFDQLASEISSQQVRDKLKEIYKTPDNIDAFVGMILEDITQGSRLGPTLGCIIATQFKRVRDGDRFWYANPAVFSPAQLTEIRQASLGRIICDNTDIKTIPKDVFLNTPVSEFVSCDEIPRPDIRAWVECCDSCQSNDGNYETLSAHLRRNPDRRSRRSIDEFDGDFTSFSQHYTRRKTQPSHIFENNSTSSKKKVNVSASREAFSILKPDTKLDNSKLTKSLVKLAKQLKQNIPSLIKEDPMINTVTPELTDDLSQTQSNSVEENIDPDMKLSEPIVGQLLHVIQSLEHKLNNLQSEVNRLQTMNIGNKEKDIDK